MRAADVMTKDVISVEANTEVRDIAKLLLKNRISAVPVIDSDKTLLGIVSEGDLVRRHEIDTEKRHSWWLEVLMSQQEKADEFIKAHGRKASDVMTSRVVSVEEDSPLHEIARLLEQNHIKRVPVTRSGKLVGIVSRANLIQGLAVQGTEIIDSNSSNDQSIREILLKSLSEVVAAKAINVIVTDGVVELWGIVNSATEKKAAEVSAENVPGVKSVENNLGILPVVAD